MNTKYITYKSKNNYLQRGGFLGFGKTSCPVCEKCEPCVCNCVARYNKPLPAPPKVPSPPPRGESINQPTQFAPQPPPRKQLPALPPPPRKQPPPPPPRKQPPPPPPRKKLPLPSEKQSLVGSTDLAKQIEMTTKTLKPVEEPSTVNKPSQQQQPFDMAKILARRDAIALTDDNSNEEEDDDWAGGSRMYQSNRQKYIRYK